MKSPLYILILMLAVGLLFGTTNRAKENLITLENKAILLKRMIKSSNTSMHVFYKKMNYRPIWFNHNNSDARIDSLLNILNNAMDYGLDPKMYHIQELQHLRQQFNAQIEKGILDSETMAFEILMSRAYLRFAHHLYLGRVKNIDKYSRLPQKEAFNNMVSYLAKGGLRDSVFDYLFRLEPQQKQYKQLQRLFAIYKDTASRSTQKIIVPTYKLDSIKSYQLTKQALINHGYLKDDENLQEALKQFQKNHGLQIDGLVGTNTAKALSRTPLYYFQNAIISLERWRWKPRWEKSYILVNIPSFSLEYIVNGTELLQSKVVVGKKSTPTPEIYSSLSYLVVYPYWNVPKSISVKEILVNAKKDSSYLKKHKYEVLTKALEPIDLNQVNWDTINLDNFNYYFRQKGGALNALGLVKFIFPNSKTVYFHDTPSKHHFKRSLRAYSHGCVRVENAFELTDNLLTIDNNIYNLDSVYSFIGKKKEKKIDLETKTPIYLQYITCQTQDDDIIFYPDLYGLDDKIRKELF